MAHRRFRSFSAFPVELAADCKPKSDQADVGSPKTGRKNSSGSDGQQGASDAQVRASPKFKLPRMRRRHAGRSYRDVTSREAVRRRSRRGFEHLRIKVGDEEDEPDEEQEEEDAGSEEGKADPAAVSIQPRKERPRRALGLSVSWAPMLVEIANDKLKTAVASSFQQYVICTPQALKNYDQDSVVDEEFEHLDIVGKKPKHFNLSPHACICWSPRPEEDWMGFPIWDVPSPTVGPTEEEIDEMYSIFGRRSANDSHENSRTEVHALRYEDFVFRDCEPIPNSPSEDGDSLDASNSQSRSTTPVNACTRKDEPDASCPRYGSMTPDKGSADDDGLDADAAALTPSSVSALDGSVDSSSSQGLVKVRLGHLREKLDRQMKLNEANGQKVYCSDMVARYEELARIRRHQRSISLGFEE